jgi:sugar lactone lactonase YvrE
MTRKTTLKVTTGAAVAGLVVGAGFGGYQLHRWSTNWDRAAEKGAAYADPSTAPIAPELLTWQQVGHIQTGLASVKSFALLKDGSVVVAGERKLRILSASGQVVRDIPLEGMPQAVTALETPDGILLFAGMKDHVEVFDSTGQPRGKWQTLGTEAFITCLTPGATGQTLWAADAGRRVVDELDMTGKILRELGREDTATHAPGLVVPSAHLDVAVGGPDGTVWVNNPGRHEMEAFDKQGVMIRQWGEGGPGIGRFIGCCNPTDFFMLADGRIVTAEKGTPRVKVFDATGVLQSVITTDFSADAAGIDVSGDAAGRVWVLDPVSREIRIFAPKNGN